jgi:hypothetical protein
MRKPGCRTGGRAFGFRGRPVVSDGTPIAARQSRSPGRHTPRIPHSAHPTRRASRAHARAIHADRNLRLVPFADALMGAFPHRMP